MNALRLSSRRLAPKAFSYIHGAARTNKLTSGKLRNFSGDELVQFLHFRQHADGGENRMTLRRWHSFSLNIELVTGYRYH